MFWFFFLELLGNEFSFSIVTSYQGRAHVGQSSVVPQQTTMYLSRATVHQDSAQVVSSLLGVHLELLQVSAETDSTAKGRAVQRAPQRWALRSLLCGSPRHSQPLGSGVHPSSVPAPDSPLSHHPDVPVSSPGPDCTGFSSCLLLRCSWLQQICLGMPRPSPALITFTGYSLLSAGLGTAGFCPDASLLSPSAPSSLPSVE